MRLVICDGVQYDADNLPPHVDASQCVPVDQWFAENRKTGKAATVKAEPVDPPKAERATQRKRSGKR